VQCDSNGQFEFTGLTPDIYKLTVIAPGMSTFTSPEIALHAGEFRILPPVSLSVSPVVNTTVIVNAVYAISTAVIARGDDGRWKPNYSRVLAHFSAAAISNLYYPPSDRGASLVVFNGLAGIGENAVSNLVREFVLKRFTSHIPKGANGQP
jgi:hypothetical protein